ncbi:hypothetical protein [Enterobacter hormaechei]|uniref:hypothetical protein n=1 Tax=Enterobacter hormaechei TaxID=158836 RepID=UPI0004BC3295|nr:hypothetical protein [Enterobacter hormaechei]
MSIILKKKTVLFCSIIGVAMTILITFVVFHYREYTSYTDSIETNGKTGLEKKLGKYFIDNNINELEKEKENLSKQLIMWQGKPESPQKIRETQIKTDILSKNKDFDYDAYKYEYLGNKRIITYINIKSENQSIYKILYPTIDCLGKTFVPTFEGDKPKSKIECEKEVKETYALASKNQSDIIEKINNIDKHMIDTIKPLQEEVKNNGGYVQRWMAGPTYNTCSEHIAIASDNTPGAFKTKIECVDDITKKIQLVDEKNIMREKISSYIPFAIIIALILFVPVLLKLLLLIFKVIWSAWLLFIEKTFESANRTEKKIKIDANVKIKDSKDKE